MRRPRRARREPEHPPPPPEHRDNLNSRADETLAGLLTPACSNARLRWTLSRAGNVREK